MYGFSDERLELQESLSQHSIQVEFQKIPASDRSLFVYNIEIQPETASKTFQLEIINN